MSPPNERTPATKPGFSETSAAKTDNPKSTGSARQKRTWQYRVRYRREGWIQPKHRLYSRWHDLARFTNRLARNPTQNGEYPPIVSIIIDRRQVVSKWETFKTWDGTP